MSQPPYPILMYSLRDFVCDITELLLVQYTAGRSVPNVTPMMLMICITSFPLDMHAHKEAPPACSNTPAYQSPL